jgi:hypothetical protein
MAAARALELRDEMDESAHKRKRAQLKKGQDRPVPVAVPERAKGDTRDQLGKLFGVSGKTVDHATKILEKGCPELVQAVDEARMSLTTAAMLTPASSGRGCTAR